MSPVSSCRDCGAPLPSGPLAGICPGCLLDAALSTFSKDESSSQSQFDLPITSRLPWQFGRYLVVEEISRGGTGVVFRARDEALHRDVALKFLHAGPLASREAVRRLFVEGRAAGRLSHPNIMPIYEVGGGDETRAFIAMPFVPNGTLADRMKRGPTEPAQTASWLAAVARAVHHAHQHGILHRDLKPGNILFDAADQPLIADFGLARVLEEDSTVTRAEAVLGTPAYMSPEQAGGNAAELTTAADIYSLGAVLYEMLTGRPPFIASSTAALLRKIVEQEITSPISLRLGSLGEPSRTAESGDSVVHTTELQPGPASAKEHPCSSKIPRDLETICLRCLQKEPAKRYATAQELADDLDRFLRDEPILARPIGPTARLWRWCCRKPAVASLVVALNLAFALGLVGILWEWRRAVTGELTARQHQYVADMNLVQHVRDEGNLRRAQALLRAHISDPGERDLRGFEWRYLWRLCQDESRFSFTNFTSGVQMVLPPDRTFVAAASGHMVKLLNYANLREQGGFLIPNDTNRINALALSPSDTNVLATASGQTITIWNLAGTRLTGTFTLSNPAVALAFSCDGRLLAAASGFEQTIEVRRVEDRSMIWKRVTRTPVFALAFAPDCRSLVSGGGELCSPLVWDLATGACSPLPAEQRGRITAIVFSPDSQIMATGSTDSTAILWDFAQRKVLAHLIAPSAGSTDCTAFSQDGHLLATGNDDSTVRLWDLAVGQQKAIYRGHLAGVNGVAFSSDGRSILSSSWDHTLKVWDIEPPSREEILVRNNSWTTSVAFSPDGKRLISDEFQGGLTVWDTTARRLIAQLTDPTTPTGPMSLFSPNGNLLAQLSDQGIKLWDARTLASRGMLTNGFDAIWLSFSPDSRTLAAAGLSLDAFNLHGRTNRLAFWDLATMQRLHKLAAAAARAAIVCFSHDGRRVAIGYLDGEVRIWDYETERLMREFKDQHSRIWGVTFSPDDAWLVAGGEDGAVVFYNVETGSTLRPVTGSSACILGLCFTPEGKTLASAEGDGTIRLWNIATHQIALTLRGHVGPVSMGISFSPDGNLLASCGADGTVRLWPAASFNEISQSEKQRQ